MGLNKRKKQRLLRKYGNECCLCGLPFDLESPKPDITYEHVIPRAQGGSNFIENLRLSHGLCNSRRGVIPIHVYQQWLRAKESEHVSLRQFLKQEGYNKKGKRVYPWRQAFDYRKGKPAQLALNL